jgi:hypothetical protein
MSIFTGAFSARKFKINGTINLEPSFVAERLTKGSFRFSWEGLGILEGWVSANNLLEAEFENNRDWVHGSYYVFALRVDNRRIPPNMIKAHLAQMCDKWKKESAAERVPARLRRQFREQIINELTPSAPVTTRVYEVILDIRTNTVVFSGMNQDLMRRFTLLFAGTFGAKLEPMHPMGDEAELETVRNFYLWLWWAADTGFELDCDSLSISKRLCLSDMQATTTIAASDVHEIPEAKLAASSGRRPSTLKLEASYDEMTFSFALQGKDMDIFGLRFPAQADLPIATPEEREAALIDRMGLYEGLAKKIDYWVSLFQSVPGGWDAWYASECVHWLDNTEA